MRKSLFIIYIFFLAILFNVFQFFSSKSIIKSKDNTFVCKLKQKNIIFPEEGGKAKSFFSGQGEACFWKFVRVSELKTQNFSYHPEFIKSIPHNAKKACFSTYNICAFWVENEDFTDFYFIEPLNEKGSVFKTTTVLLSPELFLKLSRNAS